MSQSYVHTFFPTKADLVRALAAKWFKSVEAVSHEAAYADAPAEERVENWLLGVLRVKRDRFDANPQLFRAYLELAIDHMDLVQTHVSALRNDLEVILRDMVPESRLAEAVDLYENATLLFRTPQNIAAYRSRATDEAARAVSKALVAQLSARS